MAAHVKWKGGAHKAGVPLAITGGVAVLQWQRHDARHDEVVLGGMVQVRDGDGRVRDGEHGDQCG